MKKFILSITITLSATASFGQFFWDNYNLNFDDTLGAHHVSIDYSSNPGNIWQIGTPQKTVFTSAYSAPFAIVTDTINQYPPNDTSVFIITNIAEGMGFEWPHTVILSGQYYVNSDTLTDYGVIEFSPDNGNTWIDLLNDVAYSSYVSWSYPKPTLTGNSNGWKGFYANIAQLGPVFNIHDGDTIIYRFTFISDNVQTNKDGLMFDNFHFEDWVEGIQSAQNVNLFSIFPNPAGNFIYLSISAPEKNMTFSVFNAMGEEVRTLKVGNAESTVTIDVAGLPAGMYFVKAGNYSGRFVKE